MRLPILFALLAAGIGGALNAQSQPFRIFFDWGKPDITRDGEGILSEVVSAYQQAHPAKVYVAAHTDRSGSSSYNLAASNRRAKAVMDYLVAHGIPATAIVVSAYGESRPIVPTEDGVREVQNRRAEISFSR
jgi:outer membrane protein OmpA-like peptidoglycan-associated protein